MVRPDISESVVEEEDHPRYSSTFTESITIRKQNLSVWDVGALILNKIIGAGCLTTSGSILLSNGSKAFTVGLWALGGPYCLLCLVVYLDYGIAFPFNGGELLYLNAVWPCHDLLQAFMFSGLFITLGHDAGNSIAFAKQIVLAYKPVLAAEPASELDSDRALVSFIAVVMLAFVCLLLWISPKTGLFLNKIFALYKIVLLLVMAIAGFRASASVAHDESWGPVRCGKQSFNGVLLIIYSYGGWENANYIIGDIKTKRRDLRNGAFGAVILATPLYTLLSAGLLSAVSLDSLTSVDPSPNTKRDAPSSQIANPSANTCPDPTASQLADLGLVTLLSRNAHMSQRGLEVCVALSAFGNVVAVAYTSSKVKQALALHKFLPFSGFLSRDDHFLTPGGAIFLHWVCTSIIILVVPNTAAGYDLVVSTFSYGQLFVGACVGLGFPRLRKAVKQSRLDSIGWAPFLQDRKLIWLFGLSMCAIDVLLLVAAPVFGARTWSRSQYAGWTLPVILLSSFAGSFIYWCGFKLLKGPLANSLGWTIELRHVEGLDDLSQMQRDQRRDGVELYFHHDLREGGRAHTARRRVLDAAKWIENNT